MRLEKDMLGEKALPEEALYGINTARAMENFNLGQKSVNRGLIRAMVLVKKAAAVTYLNLGMGKPEVESAIIAACDEVLNSEDKYESYFPVQALQGGAGTSTNMNVNEVLANLALKSLGQNPGDYEVIHPLDDVNRGQSTNDVYPTALRIAAIRQLRLLSDECAKLQNA